MIVVRSLNSKKQRLRNSNLDKRDILSEDSDYSEGDIDSNEAEEACCSQTLIFQYEMHPFLESFDWKKGSGALSVDINLNAA